MKRILKIIALVILVLLIAGVVYVNVTVPKMPPGANEVIEREIEKGPNELKGVQGYAFNGSTRIWYESILPEDSVKGNILLIMGIANDAIAWPDYFIQPLVDSGYQVIRFDNRGTGLTDWFEDWNKEDAYTLEDIAHDAIAVLDALEIEKTNVIGASLGGMIAQTLCIQHPDRVHTLTSMMSTGNIMDQELPSINTSVIKDLVLASLKYGLINSEKNQIKLQIVSRLLLQGEKEYPLDMEGIAQSVLYNLRERKGYNPNVSEQHLTATLKSGSRYEDLKTLDIPTLIIHGTSDPLINFAHGKKCHKLIPHAQNLWLEGMGHDIPKAVIPEVVGGIIEHIELAP